MAQAKLTHVAFEDVRGSRKQLPAVTEVRLLRTLVRILNQNEVCSIATMTRRRQPHINTAYFCCSSQLVLYFLSHPNAQHCRNVVEDPSAAVAVYSSTQPWGTPSVGVQLFGVCRRATGSDERRAERLYVRRFPAYRRWRAGGEIGAGGEYAFYRLVVNRFKLLDESAIGDGILARADVHRIGAPNMR